MAKAVEREAAEQPSGKVVGRNLRQVRKQQGLSRSAVARSAGLTRRELVAYERGRVAVPESDLWCLAGSCGVDVGELLPSRDPLQISSDLSTIGIGDTVRRLRNPGEPDGLLREYLSMIYELRNLPPGSRVPLRNSDLAALADALGGTPENIERRLVELIGASPAEAARLRAMILPPLSLPSGMGGMPGALPNDPYASLAGGDVPPDVEAFFGRPGPFGSPPAPNPDGFPTPNGAAPANGTPFLAPPDPGAPSAWPPLETQSFAPGIAPDLPAPPAAPAPPAPHFVDPGRAPDGFADPARPQPGIGPSDPFAGPVDPTAAAAAALRDPFGPAPTGDPLAPLPLPPDPFAIPTAQAPAPTPALDVPSDVRSPFDPIGDPPSPNGSGQFVDDPFALPTPAHQPSELAGRDAADLGISVLDAIVVDDPLADIEAPSRPDADPVGHRIATPISDASPAVAPEVTPIAWSAENQRGPAAPPEVAPTPRFERAGAHWQIGGIFPATAMADDGTLALRRADARWALTDLRAPADCVIETTVDFRAGSGFGIMFRASTDDGERITGYSFDVDPVAGGGGYLVRLWEGNRQHWRPLAQAAVTDPAQLAGRHVLELTLRADQLSVVVDGEPVLTVAGLSRCTVELGREPCRGDRVGIQAWSTTEVTIESFRVAAL